MEQKPIEKSHLRKTISDIRSALDEVENDLKNSFDSDYWLMTLLCRMGELESCLDFNFNLKHNKKNAVLKPNRLCQCYEKLGGDEF